MPGNFKGELARLAYKVASTMSKPLVRAASDFTYTFHHYVHPFTSYQKGQGHDEWLPTFYSRKNAMRYRYSFRSKDEIENEGEEKEEGKVEVIEEKVEEVEEEEEEEGD
ncbi:hypothetical protein HZH66_005190 [Vespula vulgaris]|uniref:Uncharacterized protein n=1 Tax=Vespula vulgaris TaxID=7454 RepID=A0A834KA25_VESVU|nr:hypothetical protein HZH66_005190 [Vespula vulgaris]